MKKSSVILGKIILAASKLRGGGSALPGLVVEKFDKDFLSNTLSKLPRGIVAVSGTNGKTTTTKMVTELLESQGLKVFTNKTGSNFTRGVVSAIIGDTKRFKFDFDIAVLELDEAHAVKFVEQVKPDYTLLLNVLNDQVDRFGGIENTAKLLTEIAKNTKKTVVLNRENPFVAGVANSLPRSKNVVYYGHDKKIAKYFPDDDELYAGKKLPARLTKKPLVELKSFAKNKIIYSINQKDYSTSMSMSGIHNYYNAAGALATALSIEKNVDVNVLLETLSKMQPAYGRGEKLNINGTQVELILVKNPAGFQISLRSQLDNSSDIMVAVNNNYGDGLDISWLGDVDFSCFKKVSVISGACANEVASYLQKDGVEYNLIENNPKKAVSALLETPGNKQIFANYTAMFEIRKILSKISRSKN